MSDVGASVVVRVLAQPRDQVAVTGPSGAELTYGELIGWASHLAAGLAGEGVARGDAVGVCLPRDEYLPAVLLGVWLAGAAYVPLEAEHPRDRLAWMAADAGVKVVLTRGGTTPVPGVRSLDVDATARISRVGSLEVGGERGWSVPEAGDLAYVLYTSGSTGRPKGVEVTHGNVAALTAAMAVAPGFAARGVMLAMGSLGFDVSVMELWTPLALGGRCVVVEREVVLDGQALAVLLDGVGRATVFLTPTSLRMVLAAGWRGDPALTLWTGAEVLDPGLAREVLPRVGELWNLYGPTEATVTSVVHRVTSADGDVVPIGRPLPGEWVHVLGEDREPVPPGAVGELWIGGAGVAKGYRNRPSDAFALVEGERCYRTGDLVRWNGGSLEFVGRRDHQVKIRGHRIELGEVEAVLREHPAVADAAVVVRRESLAGFLVLRSPAEVEAWLRDRLPGHMVPRRWTTVAAMPTLTSGKTDRNALAALLDGPAERDRVEPRTGAERLVARAWEAALGVEKVSADDDFFALGGQSLAATMVSVRLRGELGCTVPVRLIFDHPVLADLAAELETAGSPLERIHPRQEQGPSPLSAAQRRLWFAAQIDPDGVADHAPTVLRLTGPLDVNVLLGAVRELAERHQVLRTVFAEGPVAVVRDAVPISIVDCDDLTAALDEETTRPFALESEPPLRAVLFRVSPEEHVLALTFHHIATDARSQQVLLEELKALYGGAELPPPRLQYADFAAWERADADPAWWAEHLKGLPPVLDLPTSAARPAVADWAAAEVQVTIPARVAEQVRQAAARTGGTPFMVVLAAWQLLLARLAGVTDVAVGVPEAGRHHPDVEALVGFFVNLLVLRTDVSGPLTGTELLERVREAALEAFAHADVPFERVVEAVRPERNLATTPIVQVSLNLLDRPRLDWPGAELLHVPIGMAQFDLSLDLTADGQGGYAGELMYRRDLFDGATVARWGEWFVRLLDRLTADLERPIADLDPLTAAEREELLEWGRGVPLGTAEPVVTRILAQPQDRVAVTGPSGAGLTYGELVDWASRLAGGLAREGVEPGDVVGVCLPRDEYLPAVLLAVWLAGAAYLTLDPEHPQERLGWVAADAGVKVVVTRLGVARIPGARVVDADGLLAVPAIRSTEPDALAYVLYTSGSTGRPKGVEITQGSVAALVAAMEREPGFGAGDVMPVVAPLAFDNLGSEVWTPLALGGRCVVVERDCAIDGHALAERITATGVTILDTPPTSLRMLLAAGWQGDPAMKVWTGSEVLDPALVREILPRVAELWNAYGPTETTVTSAVHRVTAEDVDTVPIGRPTAGEWVYVLQEDGRLAPPGVVGELWIGGAGVARGYRNRPGEAFVPDPFVAGGRCYRTGDLVRWNRRRLEFVGRRDHQVKIRGQRIELGEVETALRGHPAVAAIAVLVHHEHLVGYVVWKHAPDLDGLRAFARGWLPDYMVPRRWMELPALPRTGSGKIDRAALPAPSLVEPEHVPPRSTMEQLVAMIWGEILPAARIGATDDFFALGGHSLAATRMVARLREAIGCRIPVRLIFERPVLAELATELETVALAQLAAESEV
ncbi:amino acid adenylation domain-containing protein [Nonomuraea sp. NPDC050556]|uniref:amino acid adenylation domain-containing protein n=1 Tax=Nonomuraea sp. NPDC050556 TaxID=3364369 RepID=UPI0037A0984D